MKKINAETLQGILQGESMDKIAKRLRNVQEMNKTQAIRSARTLVTGAENKGRLDSHKRAEEDGIILEEKWVATKDGRTRHSHAMMNGETKKTNETFSNGLEYPGDPSGRPEEVYNCRCTMTAKVLGFKKVQVQKAMEQPKVFHEEDYRAFETGEQTNDFFYYDDEKRGLMARKKSAHGQWTSGLSQEEARVIGQYCADGYYDINNYWRKYGDWQDINAERVKHQTEMLDGVIARYDLKEPIKVYRAIQPEAFESYWDDIQRIVGTEYTDAGFMSTSPIKTSTAVNKDCIMELFIPSGKGRGAYVNNVSGFQDEEYEFLLARDSKFRVIGAEETEDKLILKMEWIGNGQ
jgi:SPP1 gp7 family putative phage head morphogenesis protein